MKKTTKGLLLFFISTFFLSGCATDNTVSSSATMPKDPTVGYLTFSASCYGYSQRGEMDYSSVKAMLPGHLYENGWVGLNCFDGSRNYEMLRLPAGEYKVTQISTMSEDNSEKYYSKLKHTIFFNVLPQKITYIGSLRFYFRLKNPNDIVVKQGTPIGGIHISIWKDASVDLPVFQAKHKNLPMNKYVVKYAHTY